MSAWQQQVRDDLRQRFAALFARRGDLAAQRDGAADAAAINEQISGSTVTWKCSAATFTLQSAL
jgi:hypothetical protein